MSKENVAGVLLDARVVPHPASISAQARSYLASFVGPDGKPHGLEQEYPADDDLAGWAEAKKSAEAALAAMMAPMAAASRTVVETIDLHGVEVHLATPPEADTDDRAYLEIHGGALLFGGGDFSRIGAQIKADKHGVRCYSADYRMPPEHPYPAALDDCLTVYRALLKRYQPENIIVGGASAGGNLAAALALRVRDEGLPVPAALVLITPELDLTESGDTFETNRLVDVVLPRPLMRANLLYAAGNDLAHPYLSPLFGDFAKGFPPTYLQAGTRDLLLSNVVRMHRALRKAGIPVEMHIGEAMPHGGFFGAPEDRELAEEEARFVAEHWGRRA